MAEWLSGRVARKTRWNDTHFSLAIAVDGPDFVAGQFIKVGMDLGAERVGRPYSLVNPPHEPLLEIYFNIVPEGPLSRRLAALESGDTILLTDSANGFLTLAEVPDDARDLWLLATGTGVGPFLSMLQTSEPWQRFDRVILGYGVRSLANLGYRDLIDRLQAEHAGRFAFVPFVTGGEEAPPGGFNCRITDALDDGRLEGLIDLSMDPARSHVMLCGHSGMISDAVAVLETRGLRRHRRREPGHISTEKYH